jgi:DNA-binding NtrC family response regulator
MPKKTQRRALLAGVDLPMVPGFVTHHVTNEAAALAALDAAPVGIVFVARKLGEVAVASIIAKAGQQQPSAPAIVVGHAGTVQEAVDAMQLGAADYLAAPIEPAVLADKLRKLSTLAEPEPAGAQAAVDYMGLTGTSAAMKQLFATIDKICRYKTNVLLLGESGTGKELIARALHARGPRRANLFVPVNCATLGHDILENELFGHEKGAFTGANELKKGLFELADGGTLFLDEIGEMDPSTQAKLLRVLERSEFRRVGGTGKVRVDLSVVAATHRNLPEAIRAGKFREDLYYRLKVVTIVVPPLREHKEDIPALIDAFIADFNRRSGGKIRGIAPQALKILMEYHWPGNVREIKNAIESAAVLATRETIGAEAFAELGGRIGPSSLAPAPQGGGLNLPVGMSLAEAERQLILATVRRYGSREEAAKSLGIGLRTLYTKLRQYGS